MTPGVLWPIVHVEMVEVGNEVYFHVGSRVRRGVVIRLAKIFRPDPKIRRKNASLDL